MAHRGSPDNAAPAATNERVDVKTIRSSVQTYCNRCKTAWQATSRISDNADADDEAKERDRLDAIVRDKMADPCQKAGCRGFLEITPVPQTVVEEV